MTMLHKGKGERIRLHGIDGPEKRQAFGKRAKQFTSTLVFGRAAPCRSWIGIAMGAQWVKCCCRLGAHCIEIWSGQDSAGGIAGMRLPMRC